MVDGLLTVRSNEPIGKHQAECFVTCSDKLKMAQWGEVDPPHKTCLLLSFYCCRTEVC